MSRSSPLLSDDPDHLLDHLELRAMFDPDGNASAAELAGELALGGSDDASDDESDVISASEEVEGIVDAVFTAAENRINHCGEELYPFSLDGNVLVSLDSSRAGVYSFLLLLSSM